MGERLQIVLNEWSIRTKEDKGKVITGKYTVMCGSTTVAEKSFNDASYNALKINISSELAVAAEILTSQIEATIKEFFLGKGENNE